jgi:hypothetical protein
MTAAKIGNAGGIAAAAWACQLERPAAPAIWAGYAKNCGARWRPAKAAVNGLIYLLIGIWTRNVAASFRKIFDTQGHDIGHLMDALGALNRMYTLSYSLIDIGLLFMLATLGVYLYAQLTR